MTTATSPAPKMLADSYEVVRELGRGGMGVVYECVRQGSVRRVAIKVVSVDGSRGIVRARAQREQLALAQLRSPHIVELIDIIDRGDALYFVYELVDGSSLDRIGKLSVEQVLDVATGIASALSEAHHSGFIHRDIKPSNVIVPRAAHGELDYSAAKLLDFGVAGALTKRDQGSVATVAGEIFGSPLYMSPEQVQGKQQSAAADVYGVGALLYQLLYSRTVFEGASFTELLLQIVTANASYPQDPSVPEPLRALIERCLAKDPQARFADGAALLEALQRVTRETAAGSPPAAAMVGPAPQSMARAAPAATPELAQRGSPPRSKQWWGPRWVVAAAVSGTLTLLLVGLVWRLLRSVGAPDHGVHAPGSNTAVPLLHVPLVIWLVAGIATSWLAAYLLHRAIDKRRVPLAGTVAAVLGRVGAVEDLSKSLAVDVEQLLEVCRSLDQHMLAKTLALMIGEYDKARESEDRQAALMKAVELMEKLHEKLAPWYVKRQTLLTWGVGVVGSVFSAAKTLGELFQLFHK